MITTTFFSVDQATKEKIYKELNVDEKQVKRDVQIIKDWVKQQAHLPNELEDNFIEICLIRNKFRIEQTKERLDKYFGLKSIQAAEIRKVKAVLPDDVKDIVRILPLPQLTEKMERIIIIQIMNKNVESVDQLNSYIKTAFCIAEYALRCDYSLTYRVIYDIRGVEYESLLNTAKLSSMTLAKPYLGVYFARISGIEYLNIPSFLETIYKTMKSTVMNTVLKEKIVNRISLHNNLDSLHAKISKKNLPVEYGGELKLSLEELHDIWNTEIKNNLEALEHIVSDFVSDESKRIGELKHDDIFGLNGTFKTLQVD